MHIVEVTRDKGALCADILAALPTWFGLPQSNAAYVRAVETMPMFAAVEGDAAVDDALGIEAPLVTRHSSWTKLGPKGAENALDRWPRRSVHVPGEIPQTAILAWSAGVAPPTPSGAGAGRKSRPPPAVVVHRGGGAMKDA